MSYLKVVDMSLLNIVVHNPYERAEQQYNHQRQEFNIDSL